MLQALLTRRKLWIVTISILLVGALLYTLYLGVSRAGKIPITLNIAPESATVNINDKNVGHGTAYLKPGETYKIKAHKDGFEDYETTKYISEDSSTITILLTPVSEEAKKWADEHKKLYLDAEGTASDAAEKTGESFTDKNPITTSLPFENFIYSIGYRIDQSDKSGNTIILTIDAPEGSRNAAVQQIRDLGYDPLDYKIEFSDYRNPFAL